MLSAGRTAMAITFLAFASLLPAHLVAQPVSVVEEALRRTLVDHTEARIELIPTQQVSGSLLIRRPRMDGGLLVGDVETGRIGGAAVFESMAFPLEQVRELEVRGYSLGRGALYGAIAGLVVAGGLHVACSRSEDCRSPTLGYTPLYALTSAAFAGIGGAIAFHVSGWRVVYSRTPGGLRVAEGQNWPGVEPAAVAPRGAIPGR